MFKKDLAKKWHVPKKVIDDLCKQGKLKYAKARTEKNQLAIDISDDEIRRFEYEKHIPLDPISFEETGKKKHNIAYMKQIGTCKKYAKITSRITIYSRSEF